MLYKRRVSQFCELLMNRTSSTLHTISFKLLNIVCVIHGTMDWHNSLSHGGPSAGGGRGSTSLMCGLSFKKEAKWQMELEWKTIMARERFCPSCTDALWVTTSHWSFKAPPHLKKKKKKGIWVSRNLHVSQSLQQNVETGRVNVQIDTAAQPFHSLSVCLQRSR